MYGAKLRLFFDNTKLFGLYLGHLQKRVDSIAQ